MKTKEIKGITLISLAVTIVVLLILAGISINTVIGDNGIIKKAQSSAELTKESEAKEIINRTIMEFYLTNEYETLEDFLNTKVSEGRIDKVEKNADGTLKVWKNDYSVTTENKTNSSNNNDNNMNKRIKISTTPYEGIYDSCEHEAITNVNVEPTDTTLEYSTDGINYSTTIPRIINTGTATINIRASKENYETKNVTVIAKIEKAEGKLTLSATSGISTNGDNLTFTVSGNTGTLSVVSSDTNIATVSISGSTVTVKPGTTVGTAAITVTSAATTNYNMKSATYIATIKPKFNVSSGVGYYADVDDDGIVDGVIFGDFKEGGSGKWGSVPFYPELSSYSIPTTSSTKNYYVSQSNYDGVFGSKPVLSTKDSGNSRFWVMSLNDLSSSTYSRSYATDFSRNGWKIPSKTQWLAFAAKMGVTKENYGQLGLKSEYWTSTLDKRDDPDNPNTYTIDFTQAYIRSWFMADKYIRLATTF
ncbi:MAG: type II secretion system protein [Clostridia bacterium]